MKNIPSGQIQLGVWGRCKPTAGPKQSPGGGPGGKAPQKALKSLQSTLPEVVKKSTLVGHFFYVFHLKITENNHQNSEQKSKHFQTNVGQLHSFVKSKHIQTNVGQLHSFVKVIKFY